MSGSESDGILGENNCRKEKTTRKFMANKKKIPEKYQCWIDARKKLRLSHVHIQMAKELGLNPKKMEKLNNHGQSPWKAPLPVFLEDLYFKRFHKFRPENIRTIEQIYQDDQRKREEKKERKRLRLLPNPRIRPLMGRF